MPANPLVKRMPSVDTEHARNARNIDDYIGAAAGLGSHAQVCIRFASNVADGETITIDGWVYEFDTTASPGSLVNGAAVRVDINAAQTATAASTAFAAAFNASPPPTGKARQLRAYRHAGTNTVFLIASGAAANPLDPSADWNGIVCSETMAGANNTIDAASVNGQPRSSRQARVIRVPTATEVAIGIMAVPLPFAPTSWNIRVIVTSTGAVTAWDGAVTIVPAAGDLPAIAIIDNAGATDWATTSTLQMTFFG